MRPLGDCDHCSVRPESICSVLTRADLQHFETLGREILLRPRGILFSEGAPAEATYSIISGTARLYRLSPDGARQVVGFGLPGDFLGLPTSERYSFSVDAAEMMTACRFPHSSLTKFMKERPYFMQRICHSMAHSLDLARNQMLLLGLPDAKTKTAAFLIAMQQRWARVHAASTFVPLPMGRQDIGDFLDLSIATVSRTINRLARERLILIASKGVRILDPQRLRQLAGTKDD